MFKENILSCEGATYSGWRNLVSQRSQILSWRKVSQSCKSSFIQNLRSWDNNRHDVDQVCVSLIKLLIVLWCLCRPNIQQLYTFLPSLPVIVCFQMSVHSFPATFILPLHTHTHTLLKPPSVLKWKDMIPSLWMGIFVWHGRSQPNDKMMFVLEGKQSFFLCWFPAKTVTF